MSTEIVPNVVEARALVKAVEKAWNAGAPLDLLALCSEDCHWRTEAAAPTGRREILDHILHLSTGWHAHRVAYRLSSAQGRIIKVKFTRKWSDAHGADRQDSGAEVWRLNEADLIEECFVTLAGPSITATAPVLDRSEGACAQH